jgi:APA family basic amino acid/polyamine antiporter
VPAAFGAYTVAYVANRVKPLERIIAEGSDDTRGLKRALGPLGLIAMGIGAIIGTGIFVLTGVAAATRAGPALTISFIVAGIVSALAGLCYAEVASSIPISGSAYTYTYATLGELMAWLVGWDLILEYAVGASTVAVGWSGYFASLLQTAFGVVIPQQFQHGPYDVGPTGAPLHGFANLPAAGIILLITLLLIKGTRESSLVNSIIVTVKVAIVLFFIIIGIGHINPANWHPFMPYGWAGVFSGAAFIFFAYIGFDAVSTTAEEAKNPQRDLPIGILGSLAICTVLYIAVVIVLTGMVPYTSLNVSSPVAYAAIRVGLNWAGLLISIGAIAGLTTVLLTMMFGQSRIFFSMSRDGLVPKFIAWVHPTWRTPVVSTAIFGVLIALAAAFEPIGILGSITNMGTLFAFVLVSIALIILRRRHPDMIRGFRVPAGPLVAVLAALTSIFLMIFLGYRSPLWLHVPAPWLAWIVWLAIGYVLYLAYGSRRSTMAADERAAAAASSPSSR